jgi:hypothetical protein
MAEFKITGKLTVISMREFRALLRAGDCVLRMMGLHPSLDRGEMLRVNLVPEGKLEEGDAADATFDTNTIRILQDRAFSQMATCVIHELYHLYEQDDERRRNEWMASTITARLKDDVILIANQLMTSSQRYAAFKAHLKIAYLKGDPDEYNQTQYHPSLDTAGRKYRRHKARGRNCA